jgi:hypothetical protein
MGLVMNGCTENLQLLKDRLTKIDQAGTLNSEGQVAAINGNYL